MADVKAIVDESSMFSIVTPSVALLTEALKSAQKWTSKVASLLVRDYTMFYPFMFLLLYGVYVETVYSLQNFTYCINFTAIAFVLDRIVAPLYLDWVTRKPSML